MRRTAWLIPILLVITVVATNLGAIAINAATDVESPWPLGLDVIRTHPFRWSAGLTLLAVLLGAITWWLQQRHPGPLRAPVSPPAAPSQPAPARRQRSRWMVERPAEMDRIVAALTTPEPGVLLLAGNGGFGKTTLARMACSEPAVQQHFGNRVLFLTIGRDVPAAAILGKVNDAIQVITGEASTLTDPETAGWALARALDDGPAWMLVLDDVWYPEQAHPFLQGGAHCARLMTSRLPSVAEASTTIEIGPMPASQAREVILRDLSPAPSDEMVSELTRVTGSWPLLLRIANDVLRNAARTGQDVSAAGAELCRQVRAGGPHVVDDLTGAADRGLDVSRTSLRAGAVRATVEAGAGMITGLDRSRLRELAVFAAAEPIPVSLIQTLWRATAGYDPLRSQQLCARLADFALVSLNGATVGLHDAVREVLAEDLGVDGVRATHRALLTALSAELPAAPPIPGPDRTVETAWWRLPPDSAYLWSHLIQHLLAAGDRTAAEALVDDLRWAGAQLRHGGLTGLLADAERVGTPSTRSLRELLEESGRLLAPTDPPRCVVDVLHSRLAGHPVWGPQVHALRQESPGPRLVLAWGMPGAFESPMEMGFRRNDGVVYLTVGTSGRTMLTLSPNGTARLWDLTAGPPGTRLAGPQGANELAEVWAALQAAVLAQGTDGAASAIAAFATELDRTGLAGAAGYPEEPGSPTEAEMYVLLAGGMGFIFDDIFDGEEPAAPADDSDLLRHAAAPEPEPDPDDDAMPPEATLAEQSEFGAASALSWMLGGRHPQVTDVSMSPDETWLILVETTFDEEDDLVAQRLLRHDPGTGETRTLRDTTADPVGAVAISADSAWLFTAHLDGGVRVGDPATGDVLRVLHGDGEMVVSLAVDPRGAWLAARDTTGGIRFWGIPTWQRWSVLRVPVTDRSPVGLTPGPTGSWIAADSDSGTTVLRVPRGAVLASVEDAEQVAFDPGGTRMAAISGRGVEVYDMPDVRRRASFETGLYAVALSFSPKGAYLAVLGGMGRDGQLEDGETEIYVWEVGEGRRVAMMRLDGYPAALSWIPGTTSLVVGTSRGAHRFDLVPGAPS
ncbi:NB-ARC domain-containing protein [Actinoplanes sp. NPDC051861]|uniref:NB-ARC domain-containing protein n=1 Tax=Actinoplanes sp. NPDC051861 TaxID=3155170 RepID=UPI003448DC98